MTLKWNVWNNNISVCVEYNYEFTRKLVGLSVVCFSAVWVCVELSRMWWCWKSRNSAQSQPVATGDRSVILLSWYLYAALYHWCSEVASRISWVTPRVYSLSCEELLPIISAFTANAQRWKAYCAKLKGFASKLTMMLVFKLSWKEPNW